MKKNNTANVQTEKIDNSYQNLKRIRQEKGLSLRQLAESSHLSVSFLSNYENGKVNITIASLKKVALALGVPVTDLITDDQENQDILFVPAKERYIRTLFEAEQGVALHEYLTRGSNFDMHVVIGKLPPRSNTGDYSVHVGEEFILCRKGCVSVDLDGKIYPLKEDDMIYYLSTIPHRIINEQDRAVEYLQVNTPASF